MDLLIEARELGPDDWELFRRVRLAALADAQEAFGASYADWVDAPAERWRARLADVPLNVMLMAAGEPVAMASGTAPVGGAVELISMWVAPAARGQGLAEEAIRRVRGWAAGQGADRILLSVKIENARARRLYERCGFVLIGPSPEDPTEVLMERPAR